VGVPPYSSSAADPLVFMGPSSANGINLLKLTGFEVADG
jgi:hypothetical protein